MKKSIITVLFIFVSACSLLFASNAFTKVIDESAKADVIFNLNGGESSIFQFIAGFTDNIDAVDGVTAPVFADSTITPVNSFSISNIITYEGKNVGQLSDGAFVYWIIVGNKNISVKVNAPKTMKSTTEGATNILYLSTEVVASKNRGVEGNLSDIVIQDTDIKVFDLAGKSDVMNWGYAKLQFTTGDLGADDVKADSYKAELTLTVSSNQ